MTGPAVREPAAPPRGWYEDPAGDAAWRWWDGAAWTWHTSSPVAAGASAKPHDLAAERQLTPWGTGAAVAYAAAGTLGCILAVLYSSVLRAEFHYLRAVWDTAGRAGSLGPTIPTEPSGYRALEIAVLVLTVCAEIVFATWQFRAATVARQLGYPAQLSPGWGVAFWFVPVANLFLPYRALRDCLPPGHPVRPRVLEAWLTLVTAAVLSLATGLLAGLSRPTATVLFVLAAAAWVLYALRMVKLVPVFGAEHQLAAAWLAGRDAV
ncbi:MAG TPA: DUF4328 domain-containing protein [Acidimicrobiales bacterium]|nr:DUF4328 domain-containing protein [Acidimicrobiales bacterium]